MNRFKGENKSYEILEELGQGSTGIVYRAKRFSLSGLMQDVVAIKFLKNGNSIQELIQEFDVLTKIPSKYVVKAYALENIAGKTALVMEYIDGLRLSCLMKQQLSENLQLYIGQKLADALLELEDCGLFHGDFAPQNILLDKNGKIKLIDFANHYQEKYKQCGTAGYMPDEHKLGQHQGLATDFMALGLMFPKPASEKAIDTSAALQEVKSLFWCNQEEYKCTQYIVEAKRLFKLLPLAASLVCCFLLALPKNSFTQHLDASSHSISIRSNKWFRIRSRVGDGDWTYGPVNWQRKGSKLKVEWENAEGRFVRELNLPTSKSKLRIQGEKILIIQ